VSSKRLDRSALDGTPELKLPERLDDPGILVGWSLEHEHAKVPVGFTFGTHDHRPRSGYLDPILFEADGHLMTIAPTGAGKGTGCVIPTLLRHDGPVIVVDPKGENAAVTARRRRELGQRIVVLDPMDVTGFETDRLNPMDLLNIDRQGVVDDASMLTSVLLGSELRSERDRFWVNRGMQMILGAMLYLMLEKPDQEPTLTAVRDLVGQPPSALEPIVKKMATSPDPDLRQAAAVFSVPAAETLGGISAFAQEGLDFLRGEQVRHAIQQSTFSLDEVTRGDPMSIYIVIPPEKLESHARLLRLWISVLIAAITRRRGPPPKPTLFILDEAAQLGSLPQLRQAITLLRGYGLRTWSFWQDVSQLYRLYPHDWQTMVNNCKVLQAFGSANMNAARAIAELLGFYDAATVLDLDVDEMALLIAGDEAVIAQKPNYLADPCFAGLFDANPLHDLTREIMPRPRRRQRHYRRRQPRQRPKTLAPPEAESRLRAPMDSDMLARIRGKWG